MTLREELQMTKEIPPGQELILSILLTREDLARLVDERMFKPAGITDQQFNVLRILKGGPPEGYLIREIRRRILTRSADVPRLVDRMVRMGLVCRQADLIDRRGCRVRLTPEGEALEACLAPRHDALCREVEGLLEAEGTTTLLDLLERFRGGMRGL